MLVPINYYSFMKCGKFYTWLEKQFSRDGMVGSFSRMMSLELEAPRDSDEKGPWIKYCNKLDVPFIRSELEEAWIEFREFKEMNDQI